MSIAAGTVFTFAGSLKSMTRDEAVAAVEARGGVVAKTLGDEVQVLVAGTRAGARKKRAEDMGLDILDEDAFKALLDGASAPKKTKKSKAKKGKADTKATPADKPKAKPADKGKTQSTKPAAKTKKKKRASTSSKAKPHALDDYVDRFRGMVDELLSHHLVQLMNYRVPPPADDDEIAEVEKHIGGPLDPALRSFYRQANGLQLRWISRSSPTYDQTEHVLSNDELSWNDISRGYGEATGVVCIPSLTEVLVSLPTEDRIWFDWMTDEEEVEFAGKPAPMLTFHKSIRPFDFFHFDMQMGLLLFDGQTRVLLGLDEGANWMDSRLTDVASYLETVLAHYGVVRARRAIYRKFGGHQRPPLETGLDHWAVEAPSLVDIMRDYGDD